MSKENFIVSITNRRDNNLCYYVKNIKIIYILKFSSGYEQKTFSFL